MSLYRLCPWWSAQSPDGGANFDATSLHCMRLVHSVGELLCVGSHGGCLNVYRPEPPRRPLATQSVDNAAGQRGSAEDAEFDVDRLNSEPTDSGLLLEVQLKQPILSLSSAVMIR